MADNILCACLVFSHGQSYPVLKRCASISHCLFLSLAICSLLCPCSFYKSISAPSSLLMEELKTCKRVISQCLFDKWNVQHSLVSSCEMFLPIFKFSGKSFFALSSFSTFFSGTCWSCVRISTSLVPLHKHYCPVSTSPPLFQFWRYYFPG